MKKILYAFCSIILIVIVVVGAGVRFDIPVEELKPKYANGNSKFIMIDGLSVHYRDEGNGFPLVLLHGAASSLQTWDGWVKELANEYRIIRVDLPGWGLTGPNVSKDYSTQSYVKFLESFLNELNIKSCYMTGNSLGGQIACEFAYGNKDLVKKLVLIDSGGYPLKEQGMLAAEMGQIPIFRPILRYVTPRFFVAMNLKQTYATGNKISDDIVDRYYELILRKGNRDTFIAMFNYEKEDLSMHIKDIKIPTLILWGGRDLIIPVQYAEYFHRDIMNSRAIIYDNVGHIPNEEMSEKTASDVRLFFNE